VIHFETYGIHLLKHVVPEWTDAQAGEQAATIIDDAEFCGLLEAVTVLYLRQRGGIAADLIVGVEQPHASSGAGYQRPFMTESLYSVRALLARLLADLDSMEGTLEVDADLAREAEDSMSDSDAALFKRKIEAAIAAVEAIDDAELEDAIE
jgi:hypothetical protein